MNPSIYGLYGQVPCPSRAASALFGLLLLQKHRANSFVLLQPIFGSFLTISCPERFSQLLEHWFLRETFNVWSKRKCRCPSRVASALLGLLLLQSRRAHSFFSPQPVFGHFLAFSCPRRFSRLFEPWCLHESSNLWSI